MHYDVLIVGGGPAGLSAALILGRCRRSVLVLDAGRPRNASSRAMHGFLTQDGVSPAEFFRRAREDLSEYPNVRCLSAEVVHIERHDDHFEVTLAGGEKFTGRKVLLATGVVDALPRIRNFERFYGRSLFHCPYCDAWEVQDRRLGVYGLPERAVKLALTLTAWSRDIMVFTDGHELTQEESQRLERNGIGLFPGKIASLEGSGDRLERVVMEEGTVVERDCLFFNTESYVRSELLERLGLEFSHEEGVETGKYETTHIPGLYAAGNLCRDVQLVIVAAAEGAKAAFGIHNALTKEELKE